MINDKKMNNLNSLLNRYILGIYNYELYLESIYNPSNKKKYHRGYIIKLSKYNELKNIIYYDHLKKYILNKDSKSYSNNIDIIINNHKMIYIPKLEQIRCDRLSDLINYINNNEELLIINTELWNIIGNNSNAVYIDYFIDDSKIMLILGNENICFKHNNNILNKNSIINSIESKNQELYEIIDTVIEYYNLENNFISNINNYVKNQIEIGYLINKKWIDEWQKNTHYEKIKKDYLYNNIIDKNLKNKILNYLLANNISQININYNNNNININSSKELENFLRNDSLVIINISFYKLIKKYLLNDINCIRYSYNYNERKITIYFSDNSHNSFQTNKNIIISNNIINDNSIIKAMIKIFYYQKYLNIKIHFAIQGSLDRGWMVKKDWIQKFKKYYNYETIYNVLQQKKDLLEKIQNQYSSLTDNIIEEEIINKKYFQQNFIDDIKHKERNNQLNLELIDGKMIFKEIKIKKPKQKLIKYLTNLEFIPGDVISFFLNIYKHEFNDKYIEVKYFIGKEKIIIIFNENNVCYCEIGCIYNNIFIAHLIIDFNKSMNIQSLIQLLGDVDLDNFVDEIYNQKDVIDLSNGNICYIYKLDNNINNIENKEPKNNHHSISDKCTKNIIFSLCSIFYCEKTIKKMIESSLNKSIKKSINNNNIFFNQEYYLINKDFLLHYINLFQYNTIYEYISNNNNKEFDNNIDDIIYFKFKNFYSSLIQNEKLNIHNLFTNNKFLSSDLYEYKEDKIKYYNFFSIIDENIYNSIIELAKHYNKDIIDGGIKKISLIINNGKIIINHPDLSCLLIVSLHNYNYNNIYNSDIILYFTNPQNKNEEFQKFIKSNITDLINFNFNQKINPIINNDEIIGKLILLNNKYLMNNNNNSINDINNIQNDLNNLNNYMQYSKIIFLFFKTNEYFKLNITKKFEESKDIKEEEYYIVNNNWINIFKTIFHYNEILPILIKYQNYILNENNIEKILEHFIQKQNNNYEKIKSMLNSLDKKEINQQLCKESLYQIYNNNNDDLNKYFPLYGIINKEIISLFHEIKININVNLSMKGKIIEKAKCLLGDNAIFILLENKNEIIIGNFENDIFITKIIIKSIIQNNIKIIKNNIKSKGFRYINNLLQNNKNNIIKLSNYLFLNLLNPLNVDINEHTERIPQNNNNIKLSGKLKTLLLLYINQKKIIQKTNNSMITNINNNKGKLEEVFLINIEWLTQLGYDKIKKILDESNEIKSLLQSNIINREEKEEESLTKILKYLNINKFHEIENSLKYFNEIDSFFPNSKQVYLSKIKNICLYNNFIVVNKDLKKLFMENFHIEKDIHTFGYISGYKKNIIIINTKEQQHTLLLGSIFNEEKVFKLELIFEYIYDYFIKKELSEIINNGYNSYITNKTCINNNIKNNITSPIFEGENLIIGNCYIYNKDLLNNYINYNISDELIKVVRLSVYKKILNMKINNKANNNHQLSSNKYYLVNGNWLNEFKKYYEYDKINEELNNNKYVKEELNNIIYYSEVINLKQIYSIIKYISPDIISNINNKNNNDNIIIENMNPNIIEIGYYDNSQQKQQIMIYNNFEISNIEIIQSFNSNNNNIEKYFSQCYICDKYIIINFLQKSDINNKNISMIGKLDENSIFIAKYLLIYDTSEGQNLHIKTIIKDLDTYLKELQLLNKSAPITNDNYEIIGTIVDLEEKKKKTIREYFKSCPHIGLQNIGATCYMNATLQCFSNIEKFVDFFKYNPQIDIVIQNNNNLSYSFKLLIEKLWPNNYDINNYKFYAPNEFKDKISKMNPLFEGIAANDAKDLVNFIIMTLHEELNKVENKIDINNEIIDQRNQQLIFNNFMRNFTSKNQSIISDLFYSMNCTITECFNCQTKIYNYQIYFFIIFPLEEVRKFKNQFNNNQVNIYDCFDYDKKVSIMTGNNSIYCNYCKINCNGSMFTYLVTGPEILILLLNRGIGIEFNVKINFVEYLNLYNYIEYKDTGFNYKLIGVITHIGESSMSGHFIAYCRDPITEEWYKYNDCIVSEVNDFQREVIDFAMPYLLFYQKINNKMN